MKGLEEHTSIAARGNKGEGVRRSRQEGLMGGGGLVEGSGIVVAGVHRRCGVTATASFCFVFAVYIKVCESCFLATN